jgi:hypothetical protein
MNRPPERADPIPDSPDYAVGARFIGRFEHRAQLVDRHARQTELIVRWLILPVASTASNNPQSVSQKPPEIPILSSNYPALGPVYCQDSWYGVLRKSPNYPRRHCRLEIPPDRA